MADVKTTRIVSAGGQTKLRRRRFSLATADGITRSFDATKVRIGSHPAADLVLAEPTVSRLHAQITVEDWGWRLEDLDSKNGVRVGGLRVRDADLPGACTLQLGNAELRFEVEETEAEVGLSADDRLGSLLGRSIPMRALFDRLRKVAESDAIALILGETGSGKEEVASTLHGLSARADGPFMIFDCAAVSPQLLESELFGHEKGAFTGATTRREGAVEAAEGGTLFLDEIGELPLDMQQKLLRLLERGDYQRVGASTRRTADVRFVAATHRDLARAAARGTFREDLYFRLAVIELRVPPLRDRPDDVDLLLEHFVRAQTADRDEAQRALDRLTPATRDRLRQHPWPGNVRELRNLVHRMLVLDEAPRPAPATSPATPAPAPNDPPSAPVAGGVTVDPTRPWMAQKRELVSALEARYLEAALAHADGNITHAAANAEVERMYFKRLCKKHGIL
tara:strand:+ start:1444 stop:2802 length:1359 start_codon:yes stop_codon:yes gene_type:complete